MARSTDAGLLARQPRHLRQQPEPAGPPAVGRRSCQVIAGRPARASASTTASVGPWPTPQIASDLEPGQRLDRPHGRDATARPPVAGILLRAPVGAEVRRVAPPARGPAGVPSSPTSAAFASVVPRSSPMTAWGRGTSRSGRARLGRRRVRPPGAGTSAASSKSGPTASASNDGSRRARAAAARAARAPRRGSPPAATPARGGGATARPSARRRSGRRAGASGGSGRPARWRHSPVAGLEGVVAGAAASPSRRHEVDRVEDELEHRLADEVVEVDPDPAGLDALAAAGDLALELVRGLEVDPEQAVAVRARARAAAARLDPEQVVEQRDDEVVVEVAARRGARRTTRSRAARPRGCRGSR